MYSNITRSPILRNLAIYDYWSIKKNKQANNVKQCKTILFTTIGKRIYEYINN